MKKSAYNLAFLAMGAFLSVTATSCLDEAFPENGSASADQIKDADKYSLVTAIPAYLTSYSTSYYYDCGFSGFGVWRDVMTADMPVYNNAYDYFPYYNMQYQIGDYSAQTLFWRRYYYLLQKANSVISVCDPNTTVDDEDAPWLGTALCFRAMVYMDLMRMYEFKATGVEKLDAYAESHKLWGLTVPLITEKTTEKESRNTPRIPFQHMYRFIMNDLNKAEEVLAETKNAISKDLCCRGIANGLKARLWLEMGSRFDLHAEDLQTQIQAETDPLYDHLAKLNIASAKECFEQAAIYARKVIDDGYTPLSESQWFDPINGFNSPNNSWLWCIIVTANNGLASKLVWQSLPSFLSPEALYGVSSSEYGGYHMIDARLFDEIDPNDWRRATWIDPDDAGSNTAFKEKYSKGTSMSFKEWSAYAPYCGFKFHPAQGSRETSTIGNTTSTAMMRVEEMYLIEAEAAGRSQGVAAGQQKLEAFMNNYRMKAGTSYTSSAAGLEDFINEVFRQKRIELWGEGLILWDYRRLEKAIERGYPGTNHVRAYQFNSYPNKVAPWTNFYIPDRVNQLNPACALNPDPSGAIPQWDEN